MNNNKIIEVAHLKYEYPQASRLALNDLSVDINAGEWVAIIGHNGSGKSTFAKSLNGLLDLQSGSITIDGLPLSIETVWAIRRKIGMVFQNPDNQFVGATVEGDVAFGLENQGIERAEMLRRVQDAVERVGMTPFMTREPSRLSGGQKQRVALAGIIAQQPEILILDEATSMLDPKGRQEVLEAIHTLKQETNMTVLSITHDIDEAASADRIVMLDKGQVIDQGTPAEIFAYGQRLLDLGLDVPYPEKLKAALTKLGVPMPADYLTTERMVDHLWTLHSKM
ncbi:energy-coupling factor ABC transporter ATP-binding protein [Latilactobacillus sakei]|uniref:energy-coupling factor ABC transporter ATP-binding protein n=1 Tax=Latilactobacillus sakei TaxID=1599 RepID=UPI000DCAB269|nr:energy-coupling factor ABC transporter ATP-binding protein [Latilactobacillus sakei]AWZ44941.1 energy-coupling factor ABC transporter ATP-binding protein [Latilactobacillus sakei]QMU86943.1 energy-coupling factor ABC transporter ATP-binding protein [Latilactobacillus sakei]UNC19501.1 energy-coupling factor ABC transporter ATP-binding protein [Latilactobacillus sakei]